MCLHYYHTQFKADNFFSNQFPTSNYTIQRLVLLTLLPTKSFSFSQKIEMLIETVTARRINFITFL